MGARAMHLTTFEALWIFTQRRMLPASGLFVLPSCRHLSSAAPLLARPLRWARQSVQQLVRQSGPISLRDFLLTGIVHLCLPDVDFGRCCEPRRFTARRALQAVVVTSLTCLEASASPK